MDTSDARRLLRVIIECFEAGNKVIDGVAKSILASDIEYSAYWNRKIQNFKSGTEWSGLRTVEAEIILPALRHIEMVIR